MTISPDTGPTRRLGVGPVVGAAIFEARDPDFERRAREDFARQGFMKALAARMAWLAPGACRLVLDFDPHLTQQHGFFHGGVIASLADVSGGYAAHTLLAADQSNLSVEFKLSFLAPGEGLALVADATVLKSGRSLTVCRSDVYAEREDGTRRLSATALATYMARSVA